MERHLVAKTNELAENGTRAITEVDGQEIAVFRIDGEYHAIPNYCVHQAGPLCEGELTGQMTVGEDDWEWEYDFSERIITCPWHGWKFDVTTGKNIKDDRYVTPKYDVEVDEGRVYVLR